MKRTGKQDMTQAGPAQTRYPGSRVPGMEYTTALPIGARNAAPSKLPQPGCGHCERGGLEYESTTKGKR